MKSKVVNIQVSFENSENKLSKLESGLTVYNEYLKLAEKLQVQVVSYEYNKSTYSFKIKINKKEDKDTIYKFFNSYYENKVLDSFYIDYD